MNARRDSFKHVTNAMGAQSDTHPKMRNGNSLKTQMMTRHGNVFLAILTIGLSLVTWNDCFGATQDKKLTELNLSVTFNDNIRYLSPQEQNSYREVQTNFYAMLSSLPVRKQKMAKLFYKHTPDFVKVIAAHDYQDRKRYYSKYRGEIDDKLFTILNKTRVLQTSKKQTSFWDFCHDMIRFRYPLDVLNTDDYSVEETAKKCGFGYLSRMIDFNYDPKNIAFNSDPKNFDPKDFKKSRLKVYADCVDAETKALTEDEIKAFRDVTVNRQKYEPEYQLLLGWYFNWAVRERWRFDLAQEDTSHLTPKQYESLKRILKCIPARILMCGMSNLNYGTRISDIKGNFKENVDDPNTYVTFAKKKGIILSKNEAVQVRNLAVQIVLYGKPLILVRKDENVDFKNVAKTYGFYRVAGFIGYYRLKTKNKSNVKFYQSCQDKIPKFIREATCFFALANKINPVKAQELYRDITSDTGIVIDTDQELRVNCENTSARR